jgi:hypothetical protein
VLGFPAQVFDDICADPIRAIAHQGLAADFQKDPFELHCAALLVASLFTLFRGGSRNFIRTSRKSDKISRSETGQTV